MEEYKRLKKCKITQIEPVFNKFIENKKRWATKNCEIIYKI